MGDAAGLPRKDESSVAVRGEPGAILWDLLVRAQGALATIEMHARPHGRVGKAGGSCRIASACPRACTLLLWSPCGLRLVAGGLASARAILCPSLAGIRPMNHDATTLRWRCIVYIYQPVQEATDQNLLLDVILLLLGASSSAFRCHAKLVALLPSIHDWCALQAHPRYHAQP